MAKEQDMERMEIYGPPPPFNWMKWGSIGAAVAVPMIALLVYIISINSSASASFAAMEKAYKDGAWDFDELTFDRPVVYGEVEEGEAWAHYMDAINTVEDAPVSKAVEEFLRTGAEKHRKVAREEADRRRVIRKFLTKGAHSRTARIPSDWKSIHVTKPPSLSRSRQVAALASAMALDWALEGKTSSAVQLLFDVAQFSLDQARGGGEMELHQGLGCLEFAVHALSHIVGRTSLSFSEQVSMRKGLEKLVGNWPDFRRTLLMTALQIDQELILSEQRIGGRSDKVSAGFAFGFSGDWLKGDASAFVHRMVENPAEDWGPRIDESGNSLLKIIAPNIGAMKAATSKTRGRLSVLIAAVMLQAESFRPPKDIRRWPAVEHEMSADGQTCRIWSGDFSVTVKKN